MMNHEYTIRIEPTAIPGGGSEEITFTIEDDEQGIDVSVTSSNNCNC